MINTLCGSMGSLSSEVGSLMIEVPNNNNNNNNNIKRENSSCSILMSQNESSTTKQQSVTPTATTPTTVTIPRSDYEDPTINNGLMSFPSVESVVADNEGGGREDVRIQSPDQSYWESFFSDTLEGDFMISSPIRTSITSPPHHHHHHLQDSNFINDMMVMSPVRNYEGGGNSDSGGNGYQHQQGTQSGMMMMSSPLGGPTNNNKGKGLSPLHRVFNSPNTQQFMQFHDGINNGFSLPALENFLELINDDDDFSSYSALKMVSSSSDVPDFSDCLTAAMPAMSHCCSASGVAGSSREYEDVYQTGGVVPLSQQLREERMQDKQIRRQHAAAGGGGCGGGVGGAVHLHGSVVNPAAALVLPVSSSSDQEQDSGLQLLHLLLVCAEAVSKENYMSARRYLHHLNRVVSPLGDSMQRVASCFTDALSARLAATLANSSSSSNSSSEPPFNPYPPNSLEILKIYQILYQACPYVKFAHFTANQAIFEAFEAEERVHVIDLDILQGYQWPAFMQALAARPGGAPFLRITGVGPSAESVRETGRCLTELAHSLHVPFEFHPVGEQLEDLKPHMFHRRVGEALAVNAVSRLHRVPPGQLGSLLAMIRDQAPNIVTIVEPEANHNGPYFLGRFLEALHYYSAIFDSLDATFPSDSSQRAKVEQYIFAQEIRNIVACEGPERVYRHEKLERWRRVMEGKGFKGVTLSANAVTQSKILLSLYSCDGYRLTEDKGCLLLGWQDRALLAASAWRC